MRFIQWSGAALIAALALAAPAAASHPEASLTGSNFEIDVDANLKVDDPAPSIDWASVTEIRATDKVNGTGDDSYAGGVKEDTACPGATTDSIPPNKSDLLSFHVYREPGSGSHPGFLNLAWSRVSDPSGTTLMDFEFNKSSTKCASGPNVVRSVGDLLIEYAIDQGGSRADITARTWDGSAWGPTTDLDVPSATCGGQPCAAGTINSSPILAADSDGLITLGQKAARTFGEAQIDLRLLFQANKCASFGSAMLKSRSSDSFTSQLKDFVAPVPINLQNCGQVIIRKQTDPEENPNVTTFGYTKAFNTDPTSANTFTLQDDGVKDYGKTVLFGSGYTVIEDVIPTGWEFVNVNCGASTGVTPTIVGAQVTFAIDDANDVLDCTYTNRARGTIIVEKITDDGAGSFDFTSSTLANFTLTTTAPGAGGKDSETFPNLAPGTYGVAETVPAGWNLVSATCSDGSDPASIGLSAGETVTCTFHDTRERGALRILKNSTKGGAVSNAGAVFSYTGPSGSASVTDNGAGDGDPDVGEVCVSGLLVGNYTVNETSPPDGYGDASQSDLVATVVDATNCGANPPTGSGVVTFTNPPLADIQVNFRDGGSGETSATSITCANTGTSADATPAAGWDDSVTHEGISIDPSPRTITCEIVIDP